MRRRKSERRRTQEMNDSGKHGASFAGLSRSDGEDGMNGAVDETFSNPFAE